MNDCEPLGQFQNGPRLIVRATHQLVQSSKECANYLALQQDHSVTVRLPVMHAHCFERLDVCVERLVHSLLAIGLFLLVEPFIASSFAAPVAILVPINIAVMREHVAFHQCCPRLNLEATWTLWNCATPFRQEGIFEVQHEVIANVKAPMTRSARRLLDETLHPLRHRTRKAKRIGAGAARASSSACHCCKGQKVERELSSLS